VRRTAVTSRTTTTTATAVAPTPTMQKVISNHPTTIPQNWFINATRFVYFLYLFSTKLCLMFKMILLFVIACLNSVNYQLKYEYFLSNSFANYAETLN
jgi:hypothetical protein